MKFQDSTYYLLKNCLKLLKWEANNAYGRGEEYRLLQDIIEFLDEKLSEII